MELFQAGSSQHKKRLRVTNVMAHGPGIKLVNGLAEASTIGDTIYTYRCRARFLNPRTPRSGPIQFLTVITLAPPAGGLVRGRAAEGGMGALTSRSYILSPLCG